MGNSYPLKIGTKLGDAVVPDYQPDGRVYPGHLTGRQDEAPDGHSTGAMMPIACGAAVALT
jgi:hypothetical protein